VHDRGGVEDALAGVREWDAAEVVAIPERRAEGRGGAA
jgi:hypothetical protein